MKTDGEQVDELAKELEQDEGSYRAMKIALQLFKAGYRLDPYPNGKSKPELIARIEAVEAERDKTRNLLRAEHEKWVAECFGIKMEKHYELDSDCPVCTFLAETSSVKL